MDLEKIVREEVKVFLKEELFKKEEKAEETPVVKEEVAVEQPINPMM